MGVIYSRIGRMHYTVLRVSPMVRPMFIMKEFEVHPTKLDRDEMLRLMWEWRSKRRT